MTYPVYATNADVATYLGIVVGDLPSDITRLLARASELIYHSTMGKVDDTDDGHLEACKLATCAQIEYWLELSESISISSTGAKSLSIGSFSIDFGSGSGNGSGGSASITIATRTKQYLFDEGLLYRGVFTNAYSNNTLDSDLHN